MSTIDQLSRRSLVVVTGKGGVGKTTLTAAIGRLLADRGRTVLLLEIDPRESLHQLLGTEPSGGAIVPAGPSLAVQNLQATDVIEDLVHEKVKLGALAKRIVRHPVFRHFAEGAPGFKEMAVLGYALRTVRGDYKHKADVVVLDAPATGHGASLLSAPMLLSESIQGGQLGDMAVELAGFIADPERCGVVLATLAEEMPVQEAVELVTLLETRMGRPPELVVANALYPPFPGAGAGRGGALRKRGARTGGASADATLALWRERRAVNVRELDRLRAAWSGALAELPLLPEPRGPALLDALVAALDEAIG